MTVIVAVDMFVIATATFSMLYAVIVLDHHRRRGIHFEVSRNPTHVWLGGKSPRPFLGTSRLAICSEAETRHMASASRIVFERWTFRKSRQVQTVPRSPWQAYVGRIIGSTRRECLDHVIIFNETVACCLVIFAIITRAEDICR
jgi:putative transposase